MAAIRPKLKSALLILGPLLAGLVPALALLLLVLPNLQGLCHEDYWQVLNKVLTPAGFSQNFADWFITTNEHPIVIPNLFFLLNSQLFAGSNVTLATLGWLIALLEVWVLTRLVPPELRATPFFFLIVFDIAGLLFSPAPAGDWVLGFAGVHLGLGNLLAILTLQFFCNAYFTRKGAPLFVCLTLGWMGTFTNTPGLYVWGLMSMVVILSRQLPAQFYLIPLSLMTALPYNLSLLFGPYAVPAVHTGFHPLKKIIFMLATLGGPFSASLTNATLFGVGGFILFAFAARYCYARARAGTLDYYLLTWILIAAYPLIICFSAGLIRDALGMETALSPRYRFFILPFWIALFVLLRIMLESRPLPSSYLRAFWTGCAAVAIIKTWVVGIPVLNAYLDRENSARFTAISLQLNVPDRGWIRNALTATPQDVLNLIPRLKMIQHIPFEPGGEICPPWGQTLQTKTPGNVVGSFDTLEAYQPNAYRISGEVDESTLSKVKIIVVNQNAEVRGCALTGYPRRFFGWLRRPITTGWRGYAKTIESDSELRALALNENTGSLQAIGTNALK